MRGPQVVALASVATLLWPSLPAGAQATYQANPSADDTPYHATRYWRYGSPSSLLASSAGYLGSIAQVTDAQARYLHTGQLARVVPLVLRQDLIQSDRQQFNDLDAQAFQEARDGPVQAETLLATHRLLASLELRLDDRIRQAADLDLWTPTLSSEASRFVKQFKQTLQMLRRPEGGELLHRRHAARGQTSADLVRHMTDKGLRFAPASEGQEREPA